MTIQNWIEKLIPNRQLNIRRNAAIENGEFLFYIVSECTNARKRYDDGTIVIYNDREVAEIECSYQEEIIRVSDYNEIFGRFME